MRGNTKTKIKYKNPLAHYEIQHKEENPGGMDNIKLLHNIGQTFNF
jgi:hypothetical protein